MAETQESESSTKGLADQVVKLTEGVSGIIRAGTEAATEVSVGAIRVATGVVSGVVQSVADNLNQAVADSADVAQRGVRRFCSALDSGAAKEPEPASGSATPREAKKKE